MQLYDLQDDIGEQHNLIDVYPDTVRKLTDEMQQLIDHGRSTDGPHQPNTVPVKWQRPEFK